MLRQITPTLILALGLSSAVQAETVEITRVFERAYPVSVFDTVVTCDCCKGQASGLYGKFYEVTYVRNGRTVGLVLNSHPGQFLELDRLGRPITLPFDNPNPR